MTAQPNAPLPTDREKQIESWHRRFVDWFEPSNSRSVELGNEAVALMRSKPSDASLLRQLRELAAEQLDTARHEEQLRTAGARDPDPRYWAGVAARCEDEIAEIDRLAALPASEPAAPGGDAKLREAAQAILDSETAASRNDTIAGWRPTFGEMRRLESALAASAAPPAKPADVPFFAPLARLSQALGDPVLDFTGTTLADALVDYAIEKLKQPMPYVDVELRELREQCEQFRVRANEWELKSRRQSEHIRMLENSRKHMRAYIKRIRMEKGEAIDAIKAKYGQQVTETNDSTRSPQGAHVGVSPRGQGQPEEGGARLIGTAADAAGVRGRQPGSVAQSQGHRADQAVTLREAAEFFDAFVTREFKQDRSGWWPGFAECVDRIRAALASPHAPIEPAQVSVPQDVLAWAKWHLGEITHRSRQIGGDMEVARWIRLLAGTAQPATPEPVEPQQPASEAAIEEWHNGACRLFGLDMSNKFHREHMAKARELMRRPAAPDAEVARLQGIVDHQEKQIRAGQDLRREEHADHLCRVEQVMAERDHFKELAAAQKQPAGALQQGEAVTRLLTAATKLRDLHRQPSWTNGDAWQAEREIEAAVNAIDALATKPPEPASPAPVEAALGEFPLADLCDLDDFDYHHEIRKILRTLWSAVARMEARRC